jgi:hypothetical protein
VVVDDDDDDDDVLVAEAGGTVETIKGLMSMQAWYRADILGDQSCQYVKNSDMRHKLSVFPAPANNMMSKIT